MSSIEGKLWTKLLNASHFEQLDYEPPKCGGRVFIVSQELPIDCSFRKSTTNIVLSDESWQKIERAIMILALIAVLAGVLWAP